MDSIENLKDMLSRLTASAGVSGDENTASHTAAKMLEKYGNVSVEESTGNVFFKRGNFDESKPVVLLDAHIDEIGMTVSYITEDGFLKVSNCGGLDRRVLIAQQVTVYGREKLAGIVTSTPPHLEKDSSEVPEIDDIYIDIGLDKEQAEKLVSLGDKVLTENKLVSLNGSRVTAKALDDRAGCAAIIRALEIISGEDIGCNLAVTFSSQEEVGERGAKTAAYTVEPDYAVIVDVSFAKTYGESNEGCGELGKGPMIGFAPSLSRKMSDDFLRIAKEREIPCQIEVMNGKTGTNADVIGVTGKGVKTVTVSIPEKHMHTPVEIVDLKDIENTARLIAEYILSFGEVSQ